MVGKRGIIGFEDERRFVEGAKMGYEPKNNKSVLKKVQIALTVVSVAVIILGIVFGPNHNDGKVYVNLPIVLTGIAMCILGNLAIVIAMFVKLIKDAKAYNKYLEENNVDEREEEEAFKAYINSTNHNQEATAFRSLTMWMRANKNAPKDKSVRSYVNLVLVILFLCCLVAFLVVMGINLIAGLSVLGAAFAIIILLLIINIAHKKISTNKKNIDRSVPAKRATVISCIISDETSYGSGRNYYHQTNRILSTTYLVHLDVDGETKKAYSKIFYNKGETVHVYQNKKLKDVVIIADEEAHL